MAQLRTLLTQNQQLKFSPQKLYPFEFFDLGGLDMYTPDDVPTKGVRAVYGRNFRMYNPTDFNKRVALSKRQGHSFYSVPVGETVDQQITSTTGAADQSLDTVNWVAQKFTAGSTGDLTKIDINIKNSASGTGPLIVALYSDSSGPHTLLATSSIESALITSAYQYLSARFIEAPAVVSGTAYWVVCYLQNDGTNNYKWSSSTSASTAMTSVNSGNTWSAASFEMNLKTYISTAAGVQGLVRYYSSTASPVTIFACNQNLYSVNDGTGAVTSIKSGLNASATLYDFATVNDKLYYVNGLDAPRVWNGTTDAAVGGSPPTSSQVEVHANCLFLLQPNTNYLVFSEAGTYEAFDATSFIYIPSPKTADPVIKILSVEGILYCFTRNTKYMLYGTDLLSFVLKEPPPAGARGIVNPAAVTASQGAIYFVAPDFHVYASSAGKDVKLNSERVAPILRNLANTSSIKVHVHDKKLIISYTPTGHTTNHHRLVYDLTFNEWLNDEETYTGYGIELNSQSDTGEWVLASDRVGAVYYGDQGFNDLGKDIKFDWWSKYMSYGQPAALHRIKRYYVFLSAQPTNQYVDCQIDVDNADTPTSNKVNVQSVGSIWGSFTWGTGVWDGSTYIRSRISIPGESRKTQFRFVQDGVDNPVGIEGFATYVLPKVVR